MPAINKIKKQRKKEQVRNILNKIRVHQEQITELVNTCEALVFGDTTQKVKVSTRKKQTALEKQYRDLTLEKQERIDSATDTPSEIQLLMDNWKHFATLSKPGTKSLSSDIKTLKKILSGSFFNKKEPYQKDYAHRKFTSHEILKTFHKFDLMKNNTHYAPIDKKWTKTIRIHTFFWNEYNPNQKSLFLHLLNNEPLFAKKSAQSLTEEETQFMKVLCKKYNSIKGTTQEEVEFINAATKLFTFYTTNNKKFKHSLSKAKLCTLLLETITHRYNSHWGIGHISTDLAMERLKMDMIQLHLL